MKKITCLLLLIQSGFIMAQTKTVVTQFGEKVTISPYANNGLSANNGFIQLGGPLTQPSVLTTTAAFTLAINGLQAGGASDNVVVTDANGVLKYVSRASFGGGDNLGNHIATQDLNMSGKSILNIQNAYIKNEVQILDRLNTNSNYFGIYKNNGSLGIWNNQKSVNALTINETTNNIGIGTTSPTNVLHIKATTDPIKIEGLIGSTSTTDSPVVVTSDGTFKKGAFPSINIIPNEVGTVIAIDGKLQVAQEITALMDADFNFPSPTGITSTIGNFRNVIIDNKGKFIANSSTNSFTVEATGTYQLTLNILLHLSVDKAGQFPVIGVWDDAAGNWVARVNDEYTASAINSPMNKRLQTYTLVTAIKLTQGKNYSFRVANASGGGTIVAFSTGATGTGPASFVSLKRLR